MGSPYTFHSNSCRVLCQRVYNLQLTAGPQRKESCVEENTDCFKYLFGRRTLGKASTVYKVY